MKPFCLAYMILVPKNWRDFQHYKDRNPPWIRLHKSLVDNSDFHKLSPFASKTLVYIWLLASENVDGSVDADSSRLAFRLRLPEKSISAAVTELIDAGFLLDSNSDQHYSDKPLSQAIREKNGFGSRHISDKTKRIVWERDSGKCVACQSVDDIEYDHIHPVSKGGSSEVENVQLLCRPCNRKKRATVQKDSEQGATPAQPWLDIRTSETETLQRQRQSRDITPPDGVSDSTWQSFQQLRKAKRAPITPAAIAGLRQEADKAGWTMEDALKECCARGWKGFKAEWVAVKVPIAQVTVPSSNEPDPTLAKLERDAQIPKGIPEGLKDTIAKLTRKVKA